MDDRKYQAMREHADQLHDSEDYQAAIELYNAIIADRPDDAEVILARCAAFHGLEDYPSAIADAERVLEIDPDNSRAAFNLALALDLSGNTPASVEHFERALRCDPEFAKGHLALANVLGELGRDDEAVYHYERADELGSEHEELPVWWAGALRRTGRVREAYELYVRRQDAGPSPAAAAGRGQCAYLLGDRDDEARSILEGVMAADSDDHDSLLYYLAVRFAQGASRSEVEALIPPRPEETDVVGESDFTSFDEDDSDVESLADL